MTWHPIEHRGNGRDRRLVVVLCDNVIPADSPTGATVACHTQTEVPARQHDDAERIQRVLAARGWDWTDVDDGARDYCPACVTRRAVA